MLRVVAIYMLVMLGAVSAQTVDLDQGSIRGKVINTQIGDVTKFLGIPYVAPPLGPKRFQPPTAHQGWSGVRDATNYGPNCIQKKEHLLAMSGIEQNDIDNMKFSEDCLHVNVFIPGNGVDTLANLPVMVWFHGGFFQYSSGQLVGSMTKESVDALVVKGNVIVVTLNYRLNVFGFFTLGDPLVPGNAGIMDQIWALKWVKMNIAKFGGDPKRVTIFGDDMGATSVQLHMFSEYSFGLFDRAAVSSGAMSDWIVPSKQEVAKEWFHFADKVGCGSQNYNKSEVSLCLQNKTPDELLAKLPMRYKWLVIDGHILRDQPARLLHKGLFNPVDLIVGCNNQDGDIALAGMEQASKIYQNGMPMDMVQKNLDMLSLIGYPKSNTKIGRGMQNTVAATYYKNQSDPHQNLKDTFELFTDSFFFGAAMKFAYYNMKAGKSSYVYMFEQSSPVSTRRHDNSRIQGAGLGTEVWYIMGDVTADPGVNRDLMDSMINAWSSFAYTGKPQYIDGAKVVQNWPKMDKMMTRVNFSPPLDDSSIALGTPKGVLYFNKLFPAYLKVMYMDMRRMEMAKSEAEPERSVGEPEGEIEWPTKPEQKWPPKPEGEKEPHPEGEKEPYPEGEHKSEMEPEPEAEMRMIASWVMFALVCILVVLMLVVFGVMCSVHGHLRRGAVDGTTNGGVSSSNGKYVP